MRKSIFIAIFMLISGFSNIAGAAEAEDSFLEVLISEALANNLEIQSARAELKAIKTRISEFRYMNDPIIGAEFVDDMRMYSISQQIPFPSKLLTMSQIARKETEQYEYKLEEKIQDITSQVKKRYAEIFFVNKKIETTKKSIALLKQMFYIASQGYALGNVTQSDILRAQVELTVAEENLKNFTDDRKITNARLNILLNRDLDTPLSSPDSLFSKITPLDTDSLFQVATMHHPTLKKVNKQLEKSSSLVSLAKQRYLPDFTAKLTQIERNYNFTDRRYMIGLTVPLWFWNKQRNIIGEMKADLEKVENNKESIEDQIFLAIKDNILNVEKNGRLVNLFGISIIPQAKANLKSAFTAYETNKIDFLSLLESEKILVQYELDYYRAQADLFIAIASLEQAVGTSIVNE